MKLISFALLTLSLNVYAADYSFNSDQSKLEWEGKKVSGAHQGTVSLKSGTVQLEKGALTGGEVVVNLEKMTVTDLQGEWADKLVGHLKSDDFFSVKDHPNVSFKINSVKKLKGDQFSVSGPLTIKGKTSEQSFNVSVKESAKEVNIVGEINIDRTTYNIKYGSGKFYDPKTLGDKMIDDKFTIKLNLVAKK
ncbi:MAG: lipid-binding protein [Halobacteriovorax sp.]|nr:lipid-binding protein [Halobacteriovorax sp.]